MSAGMLVSSLAYAALASKLRRRTWFIISLAGMAVGVLALGLLPSFPLLLAGALLLGLFAGPLSALLGFYIFDRIPEGNRGSALGTQNSLTLAAAPVAVFATSLIVEAWGAGAAALALAVCWGAATIWALTTHTLRDLAEEDGSAGAPSDVRTADRNAGPAAVGAEHPSVLAE